MAVEASGPLAAVQGASVELPAGPGSHVAHFTLQTLPRGAGMPAPHFVSLPGGAFFTRLELAARKHT